MDATEPAPPPLSGVVIAFNEADRIGRCVSSLRQACAEVIVMDSGSEDATTAVARECGARVVHQDWQGFARQKNAAIALATQPWVLLLDADEWLEPPAIALLRELFDSGKVESADVWQLLRRTHFLGHRMRTGSFAREPVERLFRSSFRHAEVAVHEYLDTVGARVRESRIWLEHDTARSEAEYWQKLQRYARLWADEQRARGRRVAPGRAGMAGLAYGLKQLLRGAPIDGYAGWRLHRLHMRYAVLKYRLLRDG